MGVAPPEATNRLYKNNRDGTFTDVTEKAGLTRTGWASAVTIGDYNNDGFDDLFITYWGQNVLYRNNGNGTFTDVTADAGLLQKGPLWGSGCTFVDYDKRRLPRPVRRQLPDARSENHPQAGRERQLQLERHSGELRTPRLAAGKELPLSQQRRRHVQRCQRELRCLEDHGQLRDDGGSGRFRQRRLADIYVACDSTPSLLFINKGNGTFKEEGLERGVALSEDGMEQAGMGVGIGDYDLDGNIDLFKTHFADDTDGLYHDDGTGNFSDVTLRSGFGVETRYISWGTGIVDLDNDGWPDIFVVTGTVYPEVAAKLPQYPLESPRLVFRNLGNGKFEELIEEAGPGVATPHCSRGCAFGDFDNDGDVDMVIINMNEPPSLLRNDLKGDRNWLKVLLVGTKSNRSAIGSTITARYGGKAQIQPVTAQSSFYSVNDRRIHFGLGKSLSADLEIRWTNGAVEKIPNVKANQLLTIKEGHGVVKAEKWDQPKKAV